MSERLLSILTILIMVCIAPLYAGAQITKGSLTEPIYEKASDFRFVLEPCSEIKYSDCTGKKVCISVFSAKSDTLIDRLFLMANYDSTSKKKLLEINDFDYDGYTDFKLLTQKYASLHERTLGSGNTILEYDYYMYDTLHHKFYRHFISCLRQVKMDKNKKKLSGNAYHHIINKLSQKTPIENHCTLSGPSLKYVRITEKQYSAGMPDSYSETTSYHILDNNMLRPARIEDTLNDLKTVKFFGDFNFEKVRILHPRVIDLEKRPNANYRTVYRIYNNTSGLLITEIPGGNYGLFDDHSDSIDTYDYNFDGYPDLAIMHESNYGYKKYFFFDIDKNTFYEESFINSLENLRIDVKNKTISGTKSFEQPILNKYGQFTRPKIRITNEYKLWGPGLNYVEMKTKSFNRKTGKKKIRTSYYLYENYTLKPVKRKKFQALTSNS